MHRLVALVAFAAIAAAIPARANVTAISIYPAARLSPDIGAVLSPSPLPVRPAMRFADDKGSQSNTVEEAPPTGEREGAGEAPPTGGSTGTGGAPR